MGHLGCQAVGIWGVEEHGLGFRNSVFGLGFGVRISDFGLGFGVRISDIGLGFRVRISDFGLGFRVRTSDFGLGFRVRVWGFRISDVGRSSWLLAAIRRSLLPHAKPSSGQHGPAHVRWWLRVS